MKFNVGYECISWQPPSRLGTCVHQQDHLELKALRKAWALIIADLEMQICNCEHSLAVCILHIDVQILAVNWPTASLAICTYCSRTALHHDDMPQSERFDHDVPI